MGNGAGGLTKVHSGAHLGGEVLFSSRLGMNVSPGCPGPEQRKTFRRTNGQRMHEEGERKRGEEQNRNRWAEIRRWDNWRQAEEKGGGMGACWADGG